VKEFNLKTNKRVIVEGEGVNLIKRTKKIIDINMKLNMKMLRNFCYTIKIVFGKKVLK